MLTTSRNLLPYAISKNQRLVVVNFQTQVIEVPRLVNICGLGVRS